MATLFCACRSAFELGTFTASYLALGTYNGHVLQWAVWLDIARRLATLYSAGSSQRKASNVVYYSLSFFLWPFLIFLQPVIGIYAPNGKTYKTDGCCSFFALGGQCTCFAETSLFFDATNVWAVPDLFIVTVVPYFLVHLYLDKRAGAFEWWASIVYSFLLGWYTLSELALNRKEPWHIAVNYAIALAVSAALVLFCRVLRARVKPKQP